MALDGVCGCGTLLAEIGYVQYKEITKFQEERDGWECPLWVGGCLLLLRKWDRCKLLRASNTYTNCLLKGRI